MKRSSGKMARPKSKSGHKGIKLVRKSAVKHKANRSVSRGEDNYLQYSGKFTVRLPKSLHHALVERAEKEGVSLNLFVTNALSRTVAVPSKRK